MAVSDMFEQAAHDLFVTGNAYILTDAGSLRNSWGKGWGHYSIAEPPGYFSDLEKLCWEESRRRTNSVFTSWNTDPDAYNLDQMCLFEEDDSWQQKRSRLMEWLDQRSVASSITGAGRGTTPSQRW